VLVKDTTDIIILSKCILFHHDIAEKLLMWNNITHLQTHPPFHQPNHSCLRSYTSSLDKLQNMTFLLYINYTLAKKEFSIFCLFLLCVCCRHSPHSLYNFNISISLSPTTREIRSKLCRNVTCVVLSILNDFRFIRKLNMAARDSYAF
jgi:hypothetical protein